MCPLSQEYNLFWLAAGLYLPAALVTWPRLKRPSGLCSGLFWCFLAGGLVFQSLALYMRGDSRGALPLHTPFEVLQVLSWSLVLLTLLMRHLFKLRLLGSFSAGLATLLVWLSLFMPSWDPAVEVEGTAAVSPWVSFHAALAVAAYTLFAVLAMTALMYLLQDYGLRKRQAGAIYALLPSIRKLEGFNIGLLFTGLCLLTLAVAIGGLNWLSQPAQVTPWKLGVAMLVWCGYASLWWQGRFGKIRASGFALWSVVLFVAAVASLWPLTGRPGPESPVEPSMEQAE